VTGERVVEGGDPLQRRLDQGDQGSGRRQTVEPRNIVDRRFVDRDAVGLAVVDHLEAVLDGAEQPVGGGEVGGRFLRDAAAVGQGLERVERRRGAQSRVAAAVDELVDLGVEFDLADAPPPPLQVEAGAELLALRIMVADAAGDRLDLADRAEIEAAAPDERVDGVEEIAAQRRVSGGEAGADEGGALPRESGGFVIGDGGVDGEGDRRDFARRPQAQVDAEGETLGLALLEQLQDPLADPHRRLPRLLPRAAGERRGIEQEDGIYVRRIIELAAAMLAERDDREAARRLVGGTLGDGGGDGLVQRAVREVGKLLHQPFEGDGAGQIPHRQRQRKRIAAVSQPCREGRRFVTRLPGRCDRRLHIPGGKLLRNLGKTFELELQEGRMGAGPGEGVVKALFTKCSRHTTAPVRSVGAAQQLQLAGIPGVLPP